MGRFDTGECAVPAYFYCSRSALEPERSDPAAILASIAKQLCCVKPGLPVLAPALEKYNQKSHGIGPGCLQLAEYRDLILKLTEFYPMTTIIIDALDECNPATRYDLLDALDHIQNESTNLVKVFVSSRDERDLVSRLKHFSNIDTAAAENVAAVKAFVQWRVDDYVSTKRLLRSFPEPSELKTLMIEKIIDRAQGM